METTRSSSLSSFEAQKLGVRKNRRLLHLGIIFLFFWTVTLVSGVIYLYSDLIQKMSQIKSELALDMTSERSPVSKRSVVDPSPREQALLHQNLPGLEAMQLVGGVPVRKIDKNGTIGPWVLDNDQEELTWASLEMGKTKVHILQAGLYFIYAQIFYLTTETSNSYEIVKYSPKEEEEATLSVCANQISGKMGKMRGSSSEVSCYTGVLAHLQAGDRLQLHQIEQNRILLFNRGFSHWGIIKMYTR